MKKNRWILLFSAAAILAAIISLYRYSEGASASAAINIFLSVLIVSLPLPLFLAHRLPLIRGMSRARRTSINLSGSKALSIGTGRHDSSSPLRCGIKGKALSHRSDSGGDGLSFPACFGCFHRAKLASSARSGHLQRCQSARRTAKDPGCHQRSSVMRSRSTEQPHAHARRKILLAPTGRRNHPRGIADKSRSILPTRAAPGLRRRRESMPRHAPF